MLGSPRLFRSYAHTRCPGMGFRLHGKLFANEAAFLSGFIGSARGWSARAWRRARRRVRNSKRLRTIDQDLACTPRVDMARLRTRHLQACPLRTS